MCWTSFGDERGLTLIELMVGMVMALVLMAAIYQLFISSNTIYTVQGKVVNLQQGLRGSLDLLAGDIRMAGLDPTGNSDNATIATATASRIRVLMDYNGSGSVDRDVIYQYNGTNDILAVDQNDGAGFQTLSEDVVSFSMEYELANGTTMNSPPDPSEIRIVSINACGQISGAYADQFNSTHCFNESIACRNLGL
jgi:type IV pilus assembly protein PilW